VKSVLGEFSSGVSICRNKGTQSDWGPPFCPGPPGRGGYGGLFLRLSTQSKSYLIKKRINVIETITMC